MKLIATFFAALMLVGCAGAPAIKTEIVTVNKPIAFIPKPPAVPTIEFQVDKLTLEDKNIPGKVGQAYVHDMTFLRKRIEIDDMILEQYRAGSAKFDEVEKKIHELYNSVETRVQPVPGPTVDSK